MIAELVLDLNTLVTKQELTKNRKEGYVIVGKPPTSATAVNTDDFYAQMQRNSLTTYQSVPTTNLDNNDDIFVSPIKRSVKVNGLFVVGGRISQPAIDEDEIVYFDE
jgi:hypothetical protein